MIKFLFWNINQNALESVIASLALAHDIDVLVLAECGIPPEMLLEPLNRSSRLYHHTVSRCEKIAVYTRFSPRFLKPVFESARWTIRKLKLPARAEILLVAAHLPSKLYWSEESLAFECAELAKQVSQIEDQRGHSRTILVGDLNLNPFEKGVFAAAGLNAVMTREVARRGMRTIQSRKYRFFYNPMWGFFGDRTEGPPGTYYYDRSEHATLFWNMFDQVLLRPDLLDFFLDAELKILTSDGATRLVSAGGLPDVTIASDHLPILFSLDL